MVWVIISTIVFLALDTNFALTKLILALGGIILVASWFLYFILTAF